MVSKVDINGSRQHVHVCIFIHLSFAVWYWWDTIRWKFFNPSGACIRLLQVTYIIAMGFDPMVIQWWWWSSHGVDYVVFNEKKIYYMFHLSNEKIKDVHMFFCVLQNNAACKGLTVFDGGLHLVNYPNREIDMNWSRNGWVRPATGRAHPCPPLERK